MARLTCMGPRAKMRLNHTSTTLTYPPAHFFLSMHYVSCHLQVKKPNENVFSKMHHVKADLTQGHSTKIYTCRHCKGQDVLKCKNGDNSADLWTVSVQKQLWCSTGFNTQKVMEVV